MSQVDSLTKKVSQRGKATKTQTENRVERAQTACYWANVVKKNTSLGSWAVLSHTRLLTDVKYTFQHPGCNLHTFVAPYLLYLLLLSIAKLPHDIRKSILC